MRILLIIVFLSFFSVTYSQERNPDPTGSREEEFWRRQEELEKERENHIPTHADSVAADNLQNFVMSLFGMSSQSPKDRLKAIELNDSAISLYRRMLDTITHAEKIDTGKLNNLYYFKYAWKVVQIVKTLTYLSYDDLYNVGESIIWKYVAAYPDEHVAYLLYKQFALIFDPRFKNKDAIRAYQNEALYFMRNSDSIKSQSDSAQVVSVNTVICDYYDNNLQFEKYTRLGLSVTYAEEIQRYSRLDSESYKFANKIIKRWQKYKEKHP